MEPENSSRSSRPNLRSLELQVVDAERRALEAEAKYEALLEQLPAVVYTYSPELDGPTYYVSSYVEQLLGVSPGEFYENEGIWDELLHPEDRERARLDYESFLRTGQPEEGVYRYVRRDGRVVWLHDRSRMIFEAGNRPLFVQGVLIDVTASKETELRMEHMAYHDQLTGLPNRKMFEEHLELALARARRDELAVAVMFLDLDDFKPINDVHGHASGDELLRQLSARLRSSVRETDLVARQGGDEFLVLIADLARGDEGETARWSVDMVTNRIRQAFADPFLLRVGEISVTASSGSALYPWDAEDGRGLLRLADQAMYQRKRERPARPPAITRSA
jgi:diguanylate cyclase (GGDEF)-like protein/PAS domain S-box-containing protein